MMEVRKGTAMNNVRNLVDEMQLLALGSAEDLDVSTVVKTPAAAPTGATHAWVSFKVATIHVGFSRDPVDGGAGLAMTAGTVKVWRAETVAKARFIRGAGSDGKVTIEWAAVQG
jgi:hypothetical protein